MPNKIVLGPCDGLTEARTLKWQLVRAGIIEDCTGWGKSNLEQPHSVFHFFKHHASRGYVPESVAPASTSKHCGVCYHRIDYSFRFRSKTGEPFTEVWVDENNNPVEIQFPEIMISGSECIHLADELKSLIVACRSRFKASELKFEDGLIDLEGIIKTAQDWKVECAAFPLEWFWCSPSIRDRLIWWQHAEHGGLGAHVNKLFSGTVLQRCKAAVAFYNQNAVENSAWISNKVIPKNLQRAYDLFLGKDKFGKFTSRGTYFQPQSNTKYVILTKQNAINISKRVYGK